MPKRVTRGTAAEWGEPFEAPPPTRGSEWGEPFEAPPPSPQPRRTVPSTPTRTTTRTTTPARPVTRHALAGGYHGLFERLGEWARRELTERVPIRSPVTGEPITQPLPKWFVDINTLVTTLMLPYAIAGPAGTHLFDISVEPVLQHVLLLTGAAGRLALGRVLQALGRRAALAARAPSGTPTQLTLPGILERTTPAAAPEARQLTLPGILERTTPAAAPEARQLTLPGILVEKGPAPRPTRPRPTSLPTRVVPPPRQMTLPGITNVPQQLELPFERYIPRGPQPKALPAPQPKAPSAPQPILNTLKELVGIRRGADVDPSKVIREAIREERQALEDYVNKFIAPSRKPKAPQKIASAASRMIARLRSMGEHGQALAQRYMQFRFDYDRARASLGRSLRNLPKLTDAEAKELESLLEGRISYQQASSKVKKWFDFFNPIREEIPIRAREAGLHLKTAEGLVEFEGIPNYAPRKIDWDKLDRIASLAMYGKGEAQRQAEELWNKIIHEFAELNKIPKPQVLRVLFGMKPVYLRGVEYISPFQMARKGIHIPEEIRMRADKAIISHILEAERRIAMARAFGPRNEHLVDALDGIARKLGVEAMNEASDIMSIGLGFTPNSMRGVSALSLAINLALAATANPKWLIKHLTQVTNIARITGWLRVIRAAAPMEYKRTVARLGDILHWANVSSVYEIMDTLETRMTPAREVAEKATEVVHTIYSAGLPLFIRFMRNISAGAGRLLAEDYIKVLQGAPGVMERLGGVTREFVIRQFRNAGVDILQALRAGPQAIEEAKDRLAWHFANETFFAGGVLEQPKWVFEWGDLGRAIALLRRYSYRQMAWFYEYVMKQARRDPLGTAEWLLSAVVAGELRQDLVNLFGNALLHVSKELGLTNYEDFQKHYRRRPSNLYLRLVDNVVSAFPMAMVAVHIAENEQAVRSELQLIEEAVGPVITKMARVAASLGKSVREAQRTSDIRRIARPFVSTLIQEYSPVPPPVGRFLPKILHIEDEKLPRGWRFVPREAPHPLIPALTEPEENPPSEWRFR